MKKNMQKRYDAELERHAREIAKLANERVQQFVAKWKHSHKKLSLSLTFGMGDCCVQINGELNEVDYSGLADMLQDVEDLTDGYRRACPDDIEGTL